MVMPDYVVHAMAGRARLRHPALGTEAGREKAMAVLSGQAGVKACFPGHSSLLLRLDEAEDPAALLADICAALEAALPALRPAPRPEKTGGSCPLGKIVGTTPRQLENRALLAALGLSALLGFAGSSRAHICAASAFCALVTHHVWSRRRAM